MNERAENELTRAERDELLRDIIEASHHPEFSLGKMLLAQLLSDNKSLRETLRDSMRDIVTVVSSEDDPDERLRWVKSFARHVLDKLDAQDET